jgi:hypothetical protein
MAAQAQPEHFQREVVVEMVRPHFPRRSAHRAAQRPNESPPLDGLAHRHAGTLPPQYLRLEPPPPPGLAQLRITAIPLLLQPPLPGSGAFSHAIRQL